MFQSTRTIRLPAYNGTVASGNVITLNIPQGFIYRNIYAILGGTTFAKANISNVLLEWGGKAVVQNLSAAELGMIALYNKIAATTAILEIPFHVYNAGSYGEQRMGELDTRKHRTTEGLVLSMTFTGTIIAPTLEFWAEVDEEAKPDIKKNPMDGSGIFRCFRKVSRSIGIVGDGNGLPIALGKRAFLRCAHLGHSCITHLEMLRGSQVMFNKMTVAQIQHAQNRNAHLRATQSGYLALDFALGGNEYEVFSGREAGVAQTVALNATITQADTVTVITEQYAHLLDL